MQHVCSLGFTTRQPLAWRRGCRVLGRVGERRAESRLGVVGDWDTVPHAYDREREVEEFLDASPCFGGIVHVLRRHQRKRPVRRLREQIGDERDRRAGLAEERVLGRPGSRREHGAQAAREEIAIAVAGRPAPLR